MTLKPLVPILLALMLALPVRPSEPACSRTPLHTFVERGQDLYLGELHGTVETPALMRCLVIAALERKGEKVIVSLEQDPAARDLQSAAWRGQDGRGSVAMWDLTRFLLEQEKLGRLTLHQHVPTAFDKPFDPVEYERRMGTPLRELAGQGLLLVLSGNAHSRKAPLPMMPSPYDPAGMYAGPDIMHIDVESAGGGSAWICWSKGCGVHEQPESSPFNGTPNTLMDGKDYGHDFVYLLPRFTASPPKYSGDRSTRSKMTTGASATIAAAACIAITYMASDGMRGNHFNAKNATKGACPAISNWNSFAAVPSSAAGSAPMLMT